MGVGAGVGAAGGGIAGAGAGAGAGSAVTRIGSVAAADTRVGAGAGAVTAQAPTTAARPQAASARAMGKSLRMGQFYPEMGAFAAVEQADAAAVRRHVLLHDGQADAGAADGVLGLPLT